MILLLVIILCFILYRSGTVARFLASLETEPEPHPEPVPDPIPGPPNNRTTWEKEAYYILAIQGRVNPETVHYMGDEMLKRIVRDYLDI